MKPLGNYVTNVAALMGGAPSSVPAVTASGGGDPFLFVAGDLFTLGNFGTRDAAFRAAVTTLTLA